MKPKMLLTIVLLAFVAVSVAYLVFTELKSDRGLTHATKQSKDPTPAVTEDKVIVYYFHATKRCWTCRTIESFTEEAIRTRFPEQLASGALEWRTVNVDEPENQHYMEDFEMTTRTVVLVDVENGVETRWLRLDRVWELVMDKPAFVQYIWKNTNEFLMEDNG